MENMEKIYTKNSVKQKMIRNSGFLFLYCPSPGGRKEGGGTSSRKKSRGFKSTWWFWEVRLWDWGFNMMNGPVPLGEASRSWSAGWGNDLCKAYHACLSTLDMQCPEGRGPSPCCLQAPWLCAWWQAQLDSDHKTNGLGSSSEFSGNQVDF